jgi:hypothetical protein
LDEPCIGLGAEIVGAISVGRVGRWANTVTLEDDGGQASLLERLSVVATAKFRKELGSLLDAAHLVAVIRATRPEQLGPAADLIVAVHPFNRLLSRQLIREVMPAIVAAMRVSVPSAYGSAHDVFWRVLGFVSHFLKEGSDPDSEQRDLTAAIFEGVGTDSLAEQLSNSERRDWNPWQSVSALLRSSAPQLASAVGKKVDLSRLIPHVTDAIASSMYDVDCLLSALLLNGNEPAATLIREVLSPQRKMNWRAALIAPESAVEVINAGVTFPMELGGGLPRWDVALSLLAHIGVLDAEAARSLFRANVADLADGLLYRQANGGEGAVPFVNTAMEFDRDIVLDGFRRIEVDAARRCWRDRLQGSSDELAAVKAFLAIAKEAGGAIGAMAAELEA